MTSTTGTKVKTVQIDLSQVGLEPTIPAFQRAIDFRTLELTEDVTSRLKYYFTISVIFKENFGQNSVD
jgi:hypothetical protein